MTSVLRVGFSEASLFDLHFRARFLLDRDILANWFSLKFSFPWLLVLAASVGKSVFFLAVLHFEGGGSFPPPAALEAFLFPFRAPLSSAQGTGDTG